MPAARAPRRKTRNIRRKSRMIRRNPNLKRQVYSFNRSLGYLSQAQTIAVAGIWTTGWNFSLSQVPNASEFAALFDHYRLTYVKLYIQLQVDPSAGASATASFPVLYYARDYDDSGAPTNLDDLYQHGNLKRKVLAPNKLVTIGLKPATNELVYNGAVSSYAPKWRQWIDMANTNVPYYGLKIGVENWQLPSAGILVRAKYWFQCKNTR